MNELLLEYCNSVAGESVSVQEALEFIEGLEQFNNEKTEVFYDVQEEGFLTPKHLQFATTAEAVQFVRSLGSKSITKPVIS